MDDAYFAAHGAAAAASGNLVLPYGALFPYSWMREDLLCDEWAKKYGSKKCDPKYSLFEGSGFDWSQTFSAPASPH